MQLLNSQYQQITQIQDKYRILEGQVGGVQQLYDQARDIEIRINKKLGDSDTTALRYLLDQKTDQNLFEKEVK